MRQIKTADLRPGDCVENSYIKDGPEWLIIAVTRSETDALGRAGLSYNIVYNVFGTTQVYKLWSSTEDTWYGHELYQA